MKRLIFVISLLLIPSICLAGKTGILEVYSEPPGAKIYIDGVYVGITPYQNLETPIGRHEIRASLTSDYPEQRKTITVTEEEPVTRTFYFIGGDGGRLGGDGGRPGGDGGRPGGDGGRLGGDGEPFGRDRERFGGDRERFGGVIEQVIVKKYTGRVVFASTPPGALIHLKGRPPIKAPKSFKRVDVGRYEVEFTLNGKTLKGNFDVIKNETVELVADFNKGVIVKDPLKNTSE